MTNPILLVCLTFCASFGFAIGFGVEKRLLPVAGAVGALTRVCFLAAQALTDNRFVYTLPAALFAAFLAELMARRFRTPATMFLYPAVVPLIPGDLLYNLAVCMLTSAWKDGSVYGTQMVQSLAAIAVGFAISPTLFRIRNGMIRNRARLARAAAARIHSESHPED